jgi:hypothetical protein
MANIAAKSATMVATVPSFPLVRMRRPFETVRDGHGLPGGGSKAIDTFGLTQET